MIRFDMKAGEEIMLIQDKMRKPMLEAKYLNVDQTMIAKMEMEREV